MFYGLGVLLSFKANILPAKMIGRVMACPPIFTPR